MSTIVERQIFALEYAKITMHCMLQRYIGPSFAEVETYLYNSSACIQIHMFREYRNKELVTTKIDQIMSCFCPKLIYSLNFVLVKNPMYYPKYYYLLFYNRYMRLKTPAFSTLTKLQNLKLPEAVSGVFLRVKGKRGARKDKKSLVIGDVSRHSSVKGKLKTYKGVLETPMGVMGIYVTLMFRNVK